MRLLPANSIQFYLFLFFPILVLGTELRAQNSSSDSTQKTASEHLDRSNSFELSGYGEVLFQHYDFGPDGKSGTNGAPKDSRSTIAIPRAVFEMEYFFRPDLYLESEIEFEYGGTGSALELEYEESGEYEQEVEKGGEIVLEELHLTKEFSPKFNLRIGHFILPVGLINTAHEPTEFFTTIRPESETGIIPVTWHETGIEAFGYIAGFAWRLQLVNGLDATGFSSQNWIAGGHQTRFELAQATNMATVAAIEYTGVPGLRIGGSFYRGNSTGNRPKPDMEGIDGTVLIGDGHIAYKNGPLTFRGLFLQGSLQNAELISQKNNRLAQDLQVPRTPVASGAQAWYGEVGYDILSLLSKESQYKLYPFARYEYYNSMQKTAGNIFADPRFERNIITAGVNFFLTNEVVLKADFSHRTFGLERFNDENTIGLSLGYSASFFSNY